MRVHVKRLVMVGHLQLLEATHWALGSLCGCRCGVQRLAVLHARCAGSQVHAHWGLLQCSWCRLCWLLQPVHGQQQVQEGVVLLLVPPAVGCVGHCCATRAVAAVGAGGAGCSLQATWHGCMKCQPWPPICVSWSLDGTFLSCRQANMTLMQYAVYRLLSQIHCCQHHELPEISAQHTPYS